MVLLILALQDIPFDPIPLKSPNMALEAPAVDRVIRDAAAWKEFWTSCNAGRIPAPPVPKVDFGSEAVLAVVWGVKPSSGYTVEIARIERTADAVIVHVKRRNPPRSGGQLTVLTVPVVFVRAKLPELPVKFVDVKP